MHVAILGETLYASVLASVLAGCGHFVYWVKPNNDELHSYIPDAVVNQQLLKQQQAGFLHEISFAQLPHQLDVYVLAIHPAQQNVAEVWLNQLNKHPAHRQKLMLNASNFGLHGTAKFAALMPRTQWAYLADIIQEGNAIQSFTQAQQLMVGSMDAQVQLQIRELFRPLFPRAQQYLFMPILEAEFTKLSISGMLATRISYINDLANVAEKMGIDIESVRQGMATDSRIGSAYLYPGVGFGGENFSNDVLSLANTVSNTGTQSRLLSQVWQINEQQKEILFRKLWNYYQGDLQGKTIAIWGASFKENTARVQQSAIHVLLKALWAQGVTVRLHDPQALLEIEKIYGQRADLVYCQQQYQAVEGADALFLLTAWKQYGSPDYALLRTQMRSPLILDGRNFYDPEYVRQQGFIYQGVGR